jgi:hypothetical protein
MNPTIDSCRIGIINTKALLAITDTGTDYYYANETYNRLVKQLNGFIRMLAKLEERQYLASMTSSPFWGKYIALSR